ncbi:hypothetical protein ACHAXS_013998 [Conticribra weissflogii]
MDVGPVWMRTDSRCNPTQQIFDFDFMASTSKLSDDDTRIFASEILMERRNDFIADSTKDEKNLVGATGSIMFWALSLFVETALVFFVSSDEDDVVELLFFLLYMR